MRLTLAFLILICFITGCKDKEISSKHLSSISVVRETEDNRNSTDINVVAPPEENNTPSVANHQQQAKSPARYHIIVASFSYAEKDRAERLVEQLKAKEYPAIIINSSQRYRVSIESFPTEREANVARNEYREITDRQDIWVHKIQ
ncbi:MAG: SPOR domain-containing protein [Odoribacter sp.]